MNNSTTQENKDKNSNNKIASSSSTENNDCSRGRGNINNKNGTAITEKHTATAATTAATTTTEKIGSRWLAMFESLVEYKRKHGDCNTPFRYVDDPSLGWWVQTQRQQRRKQKARDKEYQTNNNGNGAMMIAQQSPLISDDQIEELNSIGFVWELRPKHETWDDMYERFLKAQKKQAAITTMGGSGGGSNKYYKSDPKLARWLSHQRSKYNKGLLSPEHIRKLEQSTSLKTDGKFGIGVIRGVNGHTDGSKHIEKFKWNNLKKDMNQNSWDVMFQQLNVYHDKNTVVANEISAEGRVMGPPYNSKEYPKLSNWVNTQRTMYNKDILQKERIDKLKSIKFVFNLKPQEPNYVWKKLYKQLVDTYCSKKNISPTRCHSMDTNHEKETKVRKDEENDMEQETSFDSCSDSTTKNNCDNDDKMIYNKHGNREDCYRHLQDQTATLSPLDEWICTQRSYYKKGVLNTERIKMFNQIGFIWDSNSKTVLNYKPPQHNQQQQKQQRHHHNVCSSIKEEEGEGGDKRILFESIAADAYERYTTSLSLLLLSTEDKVGNVHELVTDI